ncbi:MAG: Dihydroorotate dehydrogenase [Candidatus Gottesmanbacteria bacterium GW2011_GWA2_42_18]|uniref:Dihydroorotate dehydrogenase n=2 Tax=Candidatus Gottesmaniibacteriota TaxID=1752720 RepID=A0A0G0ZDB9_9BACT|nr:MAG: Dihydroorotate dehydrogenase [Candidatus Gottesmanbacteria bacterium GW2011_GWA2_42_18]KKS73926.1 MAG: Dihydroorotate dehydrogenase [Candidatus Gottesmanbacteria bacterium GW2011_GWC2_42_8]
MFTVIQIIQRMADLSLEFCGVKFKNPFILPSGIITEIPEHKRAIEAGVGGVTLKSLTFEKREGNPLPRLWKYEHGLLNSVGLRNAGIEKGSREIAEFINEHKGKSVILVSLFSTRLKEFVVLVEKIVPLKPEFIELNLSCPNTEDELGRSLGMEKGGAGKVVKVVKKVSGKIPVLAKLSPNVTDIADIAKECEAEGADGISAINTVGPGMVIDIEKRKPIIGAKKGGVSGPGIRPIAVRCVYDIFEAVKIPILGMGGIEKWQDVVEMILAGASLIGVGTATYTKGMKVYQELEKDLLEYMEKNGIKNISEIVGAAH